jgi:hypothetical protein
MELFHGLRVGQETVIVSQSVICALSFAIVLA